MRIRIRIRFSLPRWRSWKKSTSTLSLVNAEQSSLAMGEGPQLRPIVSVSSSPGGLTSGPKVEIALKLVDKMGVVVEMRADEAVDLANELFTAVSMSERKYELKFGTDWRRAEPHRPLRDAAFSVSVQIAGPNERYRKWDPPVLRKNKNRR